MTGPSGNVGLTVTPLPPDDDRDGLCLAEVPGWRVSGAGELVAEQPNVLVLSCVGEERFAEDLSRTGQCGQLRTCC
ncbi:MAG: hypothetical protein ACRDNS_32065 [Trebonia sp.]